MFQKQSVKHKKTRINTTPISFIYNELNLLPALGGFVQHFTLFYILLIVNKLLLILVTFFQLILAKRQEIIQKTNI